MRIAVIGGLAAGPAAAAEAARLGADVVLYEAGEHVSVGACEIPYHIAGKLTEPDPLNVVSAEELARTRGFEVFTRHLVASIDPKAGRLTVEALDFGSTREEHFDRFILATGARAKSLDVPGADAAGVFSLRDAADAEAVRDWIASEDVRHAVIVGGGYVGIEMAEAMRDRGIRASVLDPSGRPLSRTLHADMDALLVDAMRADGVAVRAEKPTALRTDDAGRVRAVVTDAGEVIGCQMVIVAIGVAPRVELARAAGITVGATGAIRVDEQMQTSSRTVWACGDVVELTRVPDGAAVHWPLAPTGRRTARVAARNAARTATRGNGTPDRFAGVTGAVAVKAFGIECAGVGLDEDAAAAAGLDAIGVQIRHLTRTKVYPGSQPIDVRLVVERKTGRLLGGQLVAPEGAALRANVLVPLIRSKTSARELAEDLDLVYNPPVAPAQDPLKVTARQADKAARGLG